jgi:hypothetical protein
MSKGGSTTSTTEIPEWLKSAAQENINKARDVSKIGYTPYYGPDVAAFSPMQQQSMQSTGNAASAFGLAPQGFDAMAGMPQAQTFAGGLQGYSSAPLYQESIDQLQANRPGQYKAMTDMFIDPFTGAAPINNYTPVAPDPVPVDIGGGGGGVTPTPSDPYAGYGDTGAYVGPGMTDTTNIGGVNYPNTPPPGTGGAVTGGLMSNGDAAAGIAGNLLDSSMFGQIYEGITGNPLAGGSPDAIVSELSNDDAYGYYPDGTAVANPYDFGPSYNDGQVLSNAYDSQPPEPLTLAEQYALYGGGQNFSEAATPTTQVETVATPDFNFPMGTEEDLSLSATTTPIAAPSITEEPFGLLGTQVNDVTKAQEALKRKASEDKRIAAQAAKVKAEAANKAKIAADKESVRVAAKAKADKALKDKQAKDAVLAKAKAKKIADDKAAYEAKQDKEAKDAKAVAIAQIERQIAAEDAATKAAADKAKIEAAAKANEAQKRKASEAKRIQAQKDKKSAERLAKARAGALEDARIEAETKRTAERIAKETAKAKAQLEAKRAATAKAAKARAKSVAKEAKKYSSKGRKGFGFGL